MAIALDQANLGGPAQDDASATTVVVTTSVAVAAGARILVFAGGEASITGVADANGNTYAADRSHSNTAIVAVWSAHSASAPASSSTITVTFASATVSGFVAACSFTGVLSASALDQVNSRQSANETPGW